ncbi:tRNA (adenine57-N1/adenine58-N1)-methyltransferase catalytic subunit [Nematocida ausubeli]|uniref:tRNA (adenine(58)-N(1))-methyltransferase catalytic subunit TRM61 n=1 Tax=Nematocida ausubeli (strain ATCC PRA-371 / ERTm2) TaxID=1913371 RepID=A0A086J4Y1_NEMA1|nr:uncharacterized protein NESG_00276 [Nematocida ausubeli]KAI5163203.1 tRNA (adenine57-N1/adenine58-N1)-methyltransferase catalytic subunit [Nematocida ausubeli]KFG27199.1 hypothetical protein NESG_00276 [Nematocida ausubeli]
MHMHIEYLNGKMHRASRKEGIPQPEADTPRVKGKTGKAGIAMDLNCDRWIKTTSQRTQIIYRADASIIVYHMALPNTARVVESGTGTLGLTYALSNYFLDGHVDTVECNDERFAAAQKDVRLAGMSNVTVHHSKVLEYLMCVVERAEKVDGIFLDVPEPEEVIEVAAAALHPGGKIACFVPCIEQVQRVLEKQSLLSGLHVERLFENVEIQHKPIMIQTHPSKEYGTVPDDKIRSHTGYILILKLAQ